MVAIRAALNLEHGAMKDFYICSLSSRYVITLISELPCLFQGIKLLTSRILFVMQDYSLQRTIEA